MNQAFHSNQWQFITELDPAIELKLASKQTSSMVQAWIEQASDLRSRKLYVEFLGELKRQWAIETGVIESAFTITEGATRTLIEKGLDAALLGHQDTGNESPELVVRKIQDNLNAVEGLYTFVSGQRPLSLSYICELHQVLMAHQPAYTARDTLGNTVQRELKAGIWKTMPNNVEHPDGTVFQYCPPEHVQQQMEELLEVYQKQVGRNVATEVRAAWLHHRFTLIHPFTDGNGRIARCLATLVFLKDDWLPLVITRQRRSDYIQAIRQADAGELQPLVELFCSLQRSAIREAFSYSERVVENNQAIKTTLQLAKERMALKASASEPKIKRSYELGDMLVDLIDNRLHVLVEEVARTFDGPDLQVSAEQLGHRRTSNIDYYRAITVSQMARSVGYHANLDAYESWSSIQLTDQSNRTTAEILYSIHPVGRRVSGIMACSAIVFTNKHVSHIDENVSLCGEPFEFSYGEDETELIRRFQPWVEQMIQNGLAKWSATL